MFAVFCGCTEKEKDIEVGFPKLEKFCSEMNANISSLRTIVTSIKEGDYITSVNPIEHGGKVVGYTISFIKNNPITIYHRQDKTGGKDAHTPVIGVKQDTDGIWYWTLDGNWLPGANNHKNTVAGADGKDGVTPQLKIEGGYWHVSPDNGKTWNQLGKATSSDGKDREESDSMFQSVMVTDTEITFVTADGQTFVVKRAAALSIEFDSEDLVVMPVNATRDIHYTITTGLDDITIEAIGSGDISAEVVKNGAKTGAIRVKTGLEINENSKVVVLVSNGSQAITRTLIFEKEAIDVEENTTKVVSDAGGEVTLEFFSNVKCRAIIPEDAQSWISVVPETKEMTRQLITLAVEKNTGATRSVTVTVQSYDETLFLQYEIEQPASRDYQLAIEREALVEFYYALDGDNWYHNENWCSDKPVKEWYGVNYGGNNGLAHYESDYVESLYLYDNNLKGQIPDSFYNLTNLRQVSLPYNDIGGVFSSKIAQLKDLRVLDLRNNHIYGDDLSWVGTLSELTHLGLLLNPIKSISREIGNLKKLQILSISPLSGIIPPEIGGLINLQDLAIIGENRDWGKIEGGIPEEIGSLDNLIVLNISSLNIEGCIPKSLGNLTKLIDLFLSNNNLEGDLPKELGNLTNLHLLNVTDNRLSGQIPPELGRMPLIDVQLQKNHFSGTLPSELSSWMDNIVEKTGFGFRIWDNNWFGPIPESWQRHPMWKYLWHHILSSGSFDSRNVFIPGPDLNATDISGEVIDGETLYGQHQFTLLFEYNPIYEDFLSINFVEDLCKQHSNLDLAIVVYGDLTEEEAALLKQAHPEMLILPSSENNSINGISILRYPATCWDYQSSAFNKVTIVDSNGVVAYSTVSDSFMLHNLVCEFINTQKMQNWEKDLSRYFNEVEGNNPDNLYTSTDYSLDGTVTQIQTSSAGTGPNIIVMGDGFSDRQIASGLYDSIMQKGVEALFREEPFASYKDYFNIYCVKVISRNEGYEDGGSTALSTYFGNGATVGGNNARVISYGLKAVSEEEMDDCLFLVMMNKDAYGGTCYMYDSPNGDYGRGLSIAYFPTSSDTDTFNGLVSHEAVGHGFAKLADEYSYEYMGAVPSDAVSYAREQEAWGWNKNVDFTGDPSEVKWAQFIADSRYSAEKIGTYEGAYTYWTGAWRPTENSIMRYDTDGFYAPSRYAIWYRIGKLVYGESWKGSYEDFVAFDTANRTQAALQRRQRRNYVEKQLPPLAPPVIVGHSWRDAI